jgi:D-amino-acid dehydrogenase
MHDTGLLVASIKRGGLDWLSRLLDELVGVGYEGTLETLTGHDARDREPVLGPAITAAVYAASDQLVRPESLCDGLAGYLRNCGVQVLTGHRVHGLRLAGDHVVLDTGGGPLTARRSVLATGVDTNRLLRPLGYRLPIIGAKGYSLTLAGTAPGAKPRSALYLSEVKVGISPYQDSLRVGGFFELGARSAAIAPRRIEQLMTAPGPYFRDWRGIYDPAAIAPWAGLRPTTPDSLPFIGPVPGARNLYVAAGHGMLGMTLAPATGALLAELITNGKAPAALQPFAILRPS